jgi:hypothetical protein
MDKRPVGILLVAIGAIGLLTFPLYMAFSWNSPPSEYGAGTPWNWGMMGQQSSAGTGIGFDEAVARFQGYIATTGNRELALKEVMEFENNYYAIVYEKSTGVGAFELLIDKTGGNRYGMMGGMMSAQGLVYPEPGPNMMWNTRYHMMMGGGGMMGSRGGFFSVDSSASANMPITVEEAKLLATKYVNQNLPGASLEDPDGFYGYYTIHIIRDGKIYGMLSVNGYTGDVWFHSWHGYFMQEKDFA